MDPNQRCFNPAAYQNMPSSEVNWALLAQQWIHARAPHPSALPSHQQYEQPTFTRAEASSSSQGSLGFPPPPMPVNTHHFGPPLAPTQQPFPPYPGSLAPYGREDLMRVSAYPPHTCPPPSPQHMQRIPYMPPRPMHSMPPAAFGASIHQRMPPVPPPWYSFPAAIRPETAWRKDALTTQESGDSEYKAHYDPSLEEQGDKEGKREAGVLATEPTTEAGAMSHWLTGGVQNTEPPSHSGQLRWDMTTPAYQWTTQVGVAQYEGGIYDGTGAYPYLDQQARKRLPAWIREGLEKAEQEKRRKQEREQRETKERETQEEQQNHTSRVGKGLGKFDVDEEDESDEDLDEYERDTPRNDNFGSATQLPDSHGPSRRFTERAKSEGDASMLAVIRKLMTSVLLEITDTHIARIANEVLQGGKRHGGVKEKPKLLAKSDALAALSSFGGDAADEDEDADDDDHEGSGKDEESSSQSASFDKATSNDDRNFKAPKLPVRRPANPATISTLSSGKTRSDMTSSSRGENTSSPSSVSHSDTQSHGTRDSRKRSKDKEGNERRSDKRSTRWS